MGLNQFSAKGCFSISALAFLVGGLWAFESPAALHIQPTGTYAPGQVIVRLKNALAGRRVQATMLQSLEKALGPRTVADLVPFETDASLYKLRLSSDQFLPVAIELLQRSPQVAFAEPNVRFQALDDGIPNDPEFTKLWAMNNLGQADLSGQVGKAGSDIHIVPLWQEGFHGSRDVVVAIVDTGVEWAHPDLAGNLFTNPGEAGELATNGIDDDGNGFIDDVHGWNFAGKTRDSNDDQGHGTHVAGTIGAIGNNNLGVAGVNWQSSILPVKFLDSSGGGTVETAVEAVNYATLMKARVLNASWGGAISSFALEDAVRNTATAGLLFVAAAGNDGADNDLAPIYPAGYQFPNVIAVAATDNLDQMAKFSNYGKSSVHVAAPGVKIVSTVRNSTYAAYSGTSMAAPHVAGIAALVLSAEPQMGFAELKERLIKTSDPLRTLSRKVVAKGRVNAYNALHNIVPPSTEPDEGAWKDIFEVLESEHPYLPKQDRKYEISYPGAKAIRVHFERLETEAKFDYVIVEGPNGEVLERLTGKMENYTTDYAFGDRVVIRLRSDLSVDAWGFKIDKIQIIE